MRSGALRLGLARALGAGGLAALLLLCGPRALGAADYTSRYAAFAELLARFRAGEAELLDELRSSAASLAADFGRSDAPRVVEHYAALGPEERARSLLDNERFEALWQSVRGAEAASWPQERELVLLELRRFAAEVEGRADRVPAARALSLCARIEVEAIERGAEQAGESLACIERASSDARRALAIFESAGHQTPCLEPLWVLGRIQRQRGRLDEALRLFEECRSVARTVRSESFHEHALLALIELARLAGDALRTEELLHELAGFRRPQECWPLAREHALRLLGEDLPAAAVAFLERCAPPEAHELAEWRRWLGLARLRAGDRAGARRDLVSLAGDDASEEALLARATLELADARPELVLDVLGTSEQRASLSPEARWFALSLAGEALLASGRPEEARALLLEAVELARRAEWQLAQQALLAGTTASIFGERLGLHTIELAARAEVQLGDPLAAALLIERSQARAFGAEQLDAAGLLAWAARSEHGLVTFVCGADAGLALHVARDGAVEARTIAHGRRALADGARRLREALIAGELRRAGELGAELAEALLPLGLRARLAREPGRLLVLAHGPLERLAVEQLRVDGRSLDELATVAVLPGLVACRPPSGGALEGAPDWWLLGDPRDAAGGTDLASAQAELEVLRALHPSTSASLREGFRRESALAAIASGRPLHFATHLRRDARCSDGRLAAVGLELSGGELLCAGEIAAHARALPLVVLSACESAEGRFLDAQGLLGLARAFLETGTRNLLVTLWPIGDEAARSGSVAFHVALAAGQEPSAAARAARAAVRRAGHPAADWSALRLLGSD